MSDTKDTILETLQRGDGFLASLATITEDGAPWVRFVTGTIGPDLTIRLATSLRSKKVAHVRVHPEVHLLCGNTNPSVDAPYFQIEATAEISTDPEEKRAIRHEDLAYYFQAPDNPDWCVLKALPRRITLHSLTSMDTEVWTK